MAGASIAAEVAAGLAEAVAETGPASPAVLTRTSHAVGGNPYDAPAASTTRAQDVWVVASAYSAREMDGTLVRAGDVKLMVAALDADGAPLDPAPRVGDTVTVGGDTYRAQAVMPLAPGGVPLMFEVQGRR